MFPDTPALPPLRAQVQGPTPTGRPPRPRTGPGTPGPVTAPTEPNSRRLTGPTPPTPPSHVSPPSLGSRPGRREGEGTVKAPPLLTVGRDVGPSRLTGQK